MIYGVTFAQERAMFIRVAPCLEPRTGYMSNMFDVNKEKKLFNRYFTVHTTCFHKHFVF